MRDILFRGIFDKSKLGNEDLKECFIYGDLIQTSYETIIRERDTNIEWIVHKDSVGQYAWLNDKNGKKIFEGDIFCIDGKYLKLVKWVDESACFCLINVGELHNEYTKDNWQQSSLCEVEEFKREIEVIGNIHENPELLEA